MECEGLFTFSLLYFIIILSPSGLFFHVMHILAKKKRIRKRFSIEIDSQFWQIFRRKIWLPNYIWLILTFSLFALFFSSLFLLSPLNFIYFPSFRHSSFFGSSKVIQRVRKKSIISHLESSGTDLCSYK